MNKQKCAYSLGMDIEDKGIYITLKVKTGYCQYCHESLISNVLRNIFYFQNKVFLLFMFSCFIIFVNVSFIFTLLYYGKNGLQPLVRQNCLQQKCLQSKYTITFPAWLRWLRRWTLSSLDWLAFCFTAVSAVPYRPSALSAFTQSCYLSAMEL